MNQELHDLAPAYALGSLDDEERRQFEAHLSDCPECRDQIAAMSVVSIELAWGATTDAPPHLRQAVLTAIDSVPQEGSQTVIPITTAASRTKVRRRRWIPTTIAAAVAVLALLGWSIFGTGGVLSEILRDPTSISTQAAATEAGIGVFTSAQVVYSPKRDAGVLVIDGLAAVAANRTYELWLVDDSGAVPAGLFKPDTDGRATVLVEGDVRPGILLALTEEPAGGVDAPTGEVLLTTEIGA
jgi:anti-sigma-K factor RskA